MHKDKLNSRVILITGASRGIGRAIALRFAKEKCKIYVNYRQDKNAADEVVKEIVKLGADAVAVQADISDSGAVDAMAKTIIEADGRLDVLINNAGICKNTTVANMDENTWDDVIKTDLNSAFYMTRTFSKPLMKQRYGSIINIASISGVKGAFGSSNYAAAKGGLISLTKSSAMELGRFGVCVNAVLPGFHLTDMGKHATERYLQEVKDSSVLGLSTDMDELTEFIHLLSKAKTVSGQVFNWDSRII